MSSEEVLIKLRNYYDEYCKKLVFVNEKRLSTNNNCRMYYLDVLENDELLNYKKLFQEYLVFYVKNKDYFHIYENIRNASTPNEISNSLIEQGKSIYEEQELYPEGNIEQQGIYGELFDDFYLNIVKQEEVMMAYSTKNTFNEPNAKGVDVVGVRVEDDGNICFIYSEAKFVYDIYKASADLIDDIKGKENQLGHITKEYINKYTSFFVNKPHSLYFDKEKTELIRNKIIEINSLIVNNHLKPIDALNELNIKIRFDFFAIYHDTNTNIDERKEYFDRIANQFNENILLTGLNNYDIEIIFIPTKNKSMDLKKEFETWD